SSSLRRCSRLGRATPRLRRERWPTTRATANSANGVGNSEWVKRCMMAPSSTSRASAGLRESRAGRACRSRAPPPATGIASEAVKEEFAQHAKEEEEHLDLLAERINQLGGKRTQPRRC